MKIVTLLLFMVLEYSVSFAQQKDYHAEVVDKMVKRLVEVETRSLYRRAPINRWAYLDTVVTIGKQDYTTIDTGPMEWEGIEKLHRSSPTRGGLVRGLTQTVDRVDLTVPSGFNLTSSSMTFYLSDVDNNDIEEPVEISARFAAIWKDPKLDAIFRLKNLKYSPQGFKLDEAMTNVDKDKFQMSLTCEEPDDQFVCDDLMQNYINTWDFDLHKWVQDSLQNAIAMLK